MSIELNRIYNMDCLEGLKLIDDNSIDSIVTDPPYELGFMGKAWDKTGITYNVDIWKECYRVLKPGGHLLSFGGTRTYHRMACAIEDAGFEIRDQMQWIYGSGFPKSLDVSKAIDKATGAEREVIGSYTTRDLSRKNGKHKGDMLVGCYDGSTEYEITVPTTELSKQWQGWGTALKPANEPICVARKPLSEKNIALNILKWGAGGLNIDGCRIGIEERKNPQAGFIRRGRTDEEVFFGVDKNRPKGDITTIGRFPANVILDEEAAKMIDKQSGERKAGGKIKGKEPSNPTQNGIYGHYNRVENQHYNDTGGASRFFYCAKASRKERDIGLEDMPYREIYPQNNSLSRKEINANKNHKAKNNHPTVKPLKLIEYLIKLVTPPNGICLDPFEGSGTHALACINLGFNFIGFELNKDYFDIAINRSNKYRQLSLIE